MPRNDYSTDFLAFYRDFYPVEGDYGPKPIIPPFLARWLDVCFPQSEGNPAARNILDSRSKKSGKSALAGAVALYMASRQKNAEVLIVASDQDQAKDRVFRAVRYAVELGPLYRHAKVYRDIIELNNGSFIQAIPADFKGASGTNAVCIIFDELFNWVYESQERLFDELLPPPTQAHGVRWIASYAGWLGESKLLKRWWDLGLEGERIDDELPIFENRDASLLAMIDQGEASWRMPWITPEFIAQVKATERPNSFARLWLNEWASSETAFLPPGAWAACKSPGVKPIGPGEKVKLVLGIDASTSRDYSGIVGVQWNESANTNDVRLVRVWKPQKGFLRLGKASIDLPETIGREVERLHAAGLIYAVCYDPYQLAALAAGWEKAGIRCIEMPQTNARIESDQLLYDSVISRRIRHYGDPDLDEHIANASAVESMRGFRLDKTKTSMKIDLAVCLSMANWASLANKPSNQPDWVPDPWAYAGADPEDTPIYCRAGKGWIACAKGTETHPPGVTAANCRKKNPKNFACYACVRELHLSGFYDEQDRIAEEEARNRNEVDPKAAQRQYEEWRRSLLYGPPDPQEAEKMELAKIFGWK